MLRRLNGSLPAVGQLAEASRICLGISHTETSRQTRFASSHAENTNTFIREVRFQCRVLIVPDQELVAAGPPNTDTWRATKRVILATTPFGRPCTLSIHNWYPSYRALFLVLGAEVNLVVPTQRCHQLALCHLTVALSLALSSKRWSDMKSAALDNVLHSCSHSGAPVRQPLPITTTNQAAHAAPVHNDPLPAI